MKDALTRLYASLVRKTPRWLSDILRGVRDFFGWLFGLPKRLDGFMKGGGTTILDRADSAPVSPSSDPANDNNAVLLGPRVELPAVPSVSSFGRKLFFSDKPTKSGVANIS